MYALGTDNFIPVVATAAALLLALAGIISKRARRPPLPPGPKSSLFGLGSLWTPKSFPWRTYAEWRNLYGDIIYIYAFGNPILVLNSAKAAEELLDKRGSIYSSRPVRTMINLVGGDFSFSSMPYGNGWRKYRGLFQKHFHSRTVPRYNPIQTREAHVFLRNLLHSPDKLYRHVRRTSAAIIMKVSYGHDVREEGDIYVTLAERAMASIASVGIYGTYLVDYIPLLKHIPGWMPGAMFQEKAKEGMRDMHAMLEQPFNMVKQRIASGTAVPSVAAIELENSSEADLADDPQLEWMIQSVAGVSYAAGSDTTVSTTMTFILAMMLHPEVQRKAQEQMDKVVGPDRLPQFSDRAALPYIDWILWECLRWNPVVPLATPHATVEDDVYEGYFIPKGTAILANTWCILHDAEKYPDPFAFKPERFADQNKNAELKINNLPMAGFGYGRRICPGRWLAIDTLWITIASALAVYDVAKPKDENGVVIEQDVQYTSAMISQPEAFRCSLVPRSEEALALIRQTEDEQPAEVK
ncbi:hypothetical protein EW146_g7437 [Bondarzewia mesenterica]|uniref:Cytochrome P450 n=1 Tax=Bondarzewia mesenterica TaxID=1095465 RepID=A0A4S4LLB7_9AGAM|nr:hypothetical protein EW146_g7437 [Bondarzewia mesenterica]